MLTYNQLLVFTGTIIVLDISLCLYARKIVKRHNELVRMYKKLHEGTTYLVNMIDKNDMPVTEFDAIVLDTILRGDD